MELFVAQSEVVVPPFAHRNPQSGRGVGNICQRMPSHFLSIDSPSDETFLRVDFYAGVIPEGKLWVLDLSELVEAVVQLCPQGDASRVLPGEESQPLSPVLTEEAEEGPVVEVCLLERRAEDEMGRKFNLLVKRGKGGR